MIQLRGIQKSYLIGETRFSALQNINLSIEHGESVAIMGKSGAGKSTLLNILGCLDNFDSGNYFLDNVEIGMQNDETLSKIRNERIGFVLQDFALISHKSVIFNTMLPMFFDKTPRALMKEKALEALDSVGLTNQMHKRVNQLSGGQRQRVAIARAIVKAPLLILADEPTGALDSDTGKEVMDILMKMNDRGITLVVVTHDDDVAAYCSRKIILSDGRVFSDSRIIRQ
jgi:putative ABC transport system ATP-binding protein